MHALSVVFFFYVCFLLGEWKEHFTVSLVPPCVSDGCLVAALNFVHRRYIYGQAVVSTAAHERVWAGFQQGLQEEDPMDMLPLLLRIIRGCPGSSIRLQDLFRSDLALKRAIHKGSPNVQALAWQRIHPQHLATSW